MIGDVNTIGRFETIPFPCRNQVLKIYEINEMRIMIIFTITLGGGGGGKGSRRGATGARSSKF